MVEKKKKPLRNKEEKIKLIFQTFIDLVNKYGYSNVSTRHIAKKAQISVGTIYRYFPKGMPSIASGFYNFTIDKILDLNQLAEIEEDNPIKLFKIIIKNHLNSHRENLELYKAFDQARMSNKELFNDYGYNITELFKSIAEEIQEANSFFKSVPQSYLIDRLVRIFNILEAFIHRHLFITPIFPSDEELIDFLSQVLLMIITRD